MPAFVLVAPLPPNFTRRRAEQYLERVDAGERAVLTWHAIAARRFSTAAAARSWASGHGELLADYVVARR